MVKKSLDKQGIIQEKLLRYYESLPEYSTRHEDSWFDDAFENSSAIIEYIERDNLNELYEELSKYKGKKVKFLDTMGRHIRNLQYLESQNDPAKRKVYNK